MLILKTIFLFGLIVGTNCFYYNDTPYLEHIKGDHFFRDYYHPWYNQTVDFVQSLSNSNELNQKCRSSLKRWISGIEDNESWAIKFLESTGRTINGKLTGRNLNFGSFDFCSQFARGDAKNVDFDGKYCLVSVRTKEMDIIKTLPNFKYLYDQLTDRSRHVLNFSMGNAHGLCMPHTCEIEEVTLVVNKMFEPYGFSIVPPKYCVTATESEKLDYLQQIAIAILLIFVFLCFLSLFVTNDFLSHFSMITNFNIIYSTNFKNEKSKERSYLHFAKALMMFASIAFHTFFFFAPFFAPFFASLKEQKFIGFFEIFFERFIPFASIMFFLGGFFSMFSWYDVIKNRTMKFNFRLYLMTRYVRIAFVSIPVTLITFILPHLGSGPYYKDITNHFYQNCRKNGYKIFFLSTNLNDSYVEMCTVGNWYLSADFQAAIFAYYLIYYLVVKPKIGFLIAIVQSLAFALIIIFYHRYQDVPAFINTFQADFYEISKAQQLYFPFLLHYTVYTMGILCAYLVKTNTKPKILDNQAFRIAVWISLSALNWLVFYYPHYLEQNNLEVNKLIIALYQVLDKIIVSSMVMWTMYTLHYGYSRILSKISDWKFWIPWSRLSFSISLGQFIVLPYFIASSRNAFVLTSDYLIKEILINSTFIFILGNVIFLFFEGPLISMFKKYSGLKKRSEAGIQIDEKSNSNDKQDMNLKED